MGQYSATYSGWERLGVSDFQNLQVASALSYFYNLQQLTNIGGNWNSSNCCFIDPNSSQKYYGFAGSTYMYPAIASNSHCNAGYSGSSYHLSSGSTNSVFSSLSPSQIQNVGTYSSCSTSGNPAIFVKRWY